ncbi:NAD-dependent epimerase/dehydratase family protein [Puia dinghuensis]|uniref:Nucleoside-diphosphate sugar epimerase n=1 Tax=Puia dinghuensis TaxID=1792502 RepID=A0A8J2U8B0_9BACT|nr:NAD-dependent epimerase/dehydratase family protein [Puia dinghuensis]GGA86326.1 nucleoside-diphosphate sugar epimerase [Puia dinghuensis]
MERILVTGATGFIGGYVIRRLLQDGCSVIATSAHPERAQEQPWFGEVEYIPFDLARIDAAADLFQLLGKPHRMIHLAWEGLPNYRSAFHLEENLPRHRAFLANLVGHGLSDLTVTGTCLEYGMQEGCLSEQLPAEPGNPYAQAKDQLRHFLEHLGKEHSFLLKWVRLFYIYGKGQNPNSLFSQLDKALANGDKVFNMSKGEQVRDYLPVEKVAEYIVKIARQDKVSGIVNCCSGLPVTVRQLVEDHLRRSQRSIDLNLGYYAYPDYEPFRFWGDASKLKTIIQHE